jgi:DNA-binding transcriptional LysR family regulator
MGSGRTTADARPVGAQQQHLREYRDSTAAICVDIRHLRYFTAAVEDGQLSSAARRLHLAQPALSQSIQRLERQLGVELLHRHGRGISPTPAGAELAARATALTLELEAALAAVRRVARGEVGLLTVGFSGALPPWRHISMFKDFSAVHPEVEFAWREIPPGAVTRTIGLRHVDFALFWVPAEDEALSSSPVHYEPRVLLAAPEHPLACQATVGIEDLLEETFPGCHPDLASERLGFSSLDVYRHASPRVTSDRASTFAEVCAIVATGRAISTAPLSIARSYTSLGTVAVPISNVAPAALSLWWKQGDRNPLVQQFVCAHFDRLRR